MHLPEQIASFLTRKGWNPRVIRTGSQLHKFLFRTLGLGRFKFVGQDSLILTTRGRKTGRETATPLFYAEEHGRLCVAGSFAGSGAPPNLVSQSRWLSGGRGRDTPLAWALPGADARCHGGSTRVAEARCGVSDLRRVPDAHDAPDPRRRAVTDYAVSRRRDRRMKAGGRPRRRRRGGRARGRPTGLGRAALAQPAGARGRQSRSCRPPPSRDDRYCRAAHARPAGCMFRAAPGRW